MTRIALIHALHASIEPINAAFAALWPEARLTNLLDDSLSRDLAEAGALTGEIVARFHTLSRYAAEAGAEGILFTCSAFGSAIDAVALDLAPMPVHKPNTAMINRAVAAAGEGRIALLASFAPTLPSMLPEFPEPDRVLPVFCEGALEALQRGDADRHDGIVAEAAARLPEDCTVVALAQFSLARAAAAVAPLAGRSVLTTPACAVEGMRAALFGQGERR
ncbi:arylsulfatase [Novosphingobium humi]|uniref:Arylsulfatase n=1 Tax=Novosphingobium humi TaxID=2282397 RepID=A0ABY7U4D0_9SPHN|nr:arylsulfatase [Novosphingobium humi]WCT79229.1 arylsulfatase [Novosphingobium humi]